MVALNLPTELEEVLAKATGARFYRADLHIHSYGASHDVKDSTMVPSAIVQTALDRNLNIVSITDHNEIGNVDAAIRAAGDKLCIIPGVELSTSQGHLLCYLPSLSALKKFYGLLTILESGKPNSRCQTSLLDCLSLLGQFGGFGILAHVDVQSGFEIEVPGNSPHKVDILCHPNLLGIELKKSSSTISYGADDTDPDRAAIGKERIKRLKLGTRQYLARVLNSDAHSLQALGRNAEEAERLTRCKMDLPSFAALKAALQDAEARVRLEDLIPPTIPKILGVKMVGGFLDGQIIHFNPNLNCIIGGRGTGKSTALESVRCLSGDMSDSKVIDTEVWPDEIHLFWQDEAEQTHTLLRRKDGVIQNCDDPLLGQTAFDIDCFGQGDAMKIGARAKENPLILLDYLDRFVNNLPEALAAEERTRTELISVQGKIEEAEANVKQIPEYESRLKSIRNTLQALKKPDVKELIELKQNLATEQTLRNSIASKIHAAKNDSSRSSLKQLGNEIRAAGWTEGVALGKDEFTAILAGVDAFERGIGAAEIQIGSSLKALDDLVAAEFTRWKNKEAEAQKKIDQKKRELDVQKIPFDITHIGKLTTDEANCDQSVKNLNTWVPELQRLKTLKAQTIRQRMEYRNKVAAFRSAFGMKATKILKEAVTDLKVSLKYSANAHSPDALGHIINAMNWRTSAQEKARQLVEELTVPALLNAINAKDIKPLLALTDVLDCEVFDKSEAERILDRLNEPAVRFALECAKLYDLPRLQVTGQVTDASGKQSYRVRDFTKLSLGQQQSIMLALMLSSDRTAPLIIDQPEDNLDGEFIHKALVPVLRRAKERRQIIIVTHNPNVAVLGDAELLVAMKANDENGRIVMRGSIDHDPTRVLACAILEGSEEAYLGRGKAYGYEFRPASSIEDLSAAIFPEANRG